MPNAITVYFFLLLRLFHITYSLLGAVFQNYASQPSLTPDDDVFKHLSLTYANNHAKMSRGVACKSATPQFEQGITNGAQVSTTHITNRSIYPCHILTLFLIYI